MWNSVALLNTIASLGIWIGAISGSVAVAAALIGGLAANRSSEITSRLANVEIVNANTRAEEAKANAAEANARAEEAKAEAAKVNERLQKSQETRTLTTGEVEELTHLFKSDVFQKPEPKKLKVSSVEDSEARMFAMQFQNLLESCGVNIYPTDGGFPQTCVQLTPDAGPLSLAVSSLEVSSETQHLVYFQRTMIALGFDMKVEVNSDLRPDEGVFYVLRKAKV